jgi:hypothetical protein
VKPRFFVLFACTCLALAGCASDPNSGGGYFDTGDNNLHDYGRRVWP